MKYALASKKDSKARVSLCTKLPATLYVFALLTINRKSASNSKRSLYCPCSNFAFIVLRSIGDLMMSK